MASVGAFSEAGEEGGGSGSGAPTDATYIVQTANGGLSAEQALGALATGILFSTTTTGVVSILSVGSGLTLTASTLTSNLITGLAGGQTVIGGTAASEVLTLQGTSNGAAGKVKTLDPLVLAAGTQANNSIQHPSNAGTGLYFGSSTQVIFTANGTIAGSYTASAFNFQVSLQVAGGVAMSDANNISLATGTGTKLGTGPTQKLGFWNAPPVIQPATAGTTTGFTLVGASAIVAPESTFTGGTGSKAYTIGDVILALKQAGIMAPS